MDDPSHTMHYGRQRTTEKKTALYENNFQHFVARGATASILYVAHSFFMEPQLVYHVLCNHQLYCALI